MRTWLKHFTTRTGIVIATVFALSGCFGASSDVSTFQIPDAEPLEDARPIIMVHGFFGSANQYQTQAMRFAQNGYPSEMLVAVEYDTLPFLLQDGDGMQAVLDEVFAEIDDLISDFQAEGHEQVNLMGHSLGTSVSRQYLESSSERADNVARYVNIDGSGGETAPAGVPTLAIWDFRDRGPMDGAENITFDNQGHVEVATSREAFEEMFSFLRDGDEPPMPEIIAWRDGTPVELSGRAIEFPVNTAITDGTIEIYEVDGDTGLRTNPAPVFTQTPDGNGRWGPFTAKAGAHYEFVIARDGVIDQHSFTEPPVRDNHMVRLLTLPSDGDLNIIGDLIRSGPDHTNLVILRDKEFWADQADNDILTINDQTVTTPALTPREGGSALGGSIGIFVFDSDTDDGDSPEDHQAGQSNLTVPEPVVSQLPFILGLDMFLTTSPQDSTISVSLTGRNTTGETRVVNVPNLPSDEFRVGIRFNDFVPVPAD